MFDTAKIITEAVDFTVTGKVGPELAKLSPADRRAATAAAAGVKSTIRTRTGRK